MLLDARLYVGLINKCSVMTRYTHTFKSALKPACCLTASLVVGLCLGLTGCGDNKQGTDAKNPEKVTLFSGMGQSLNDTGITWGGDYPKDINDDCSADINVEQLLDGDVIEGDILLAQDCTHGRDAESGGFMYRKLNFKGEFLEADAESWACVLDEVSGLLWEVKQEADGEYGNRGLSDADDLFTWYNSRPGANGGSVGDWNARFNQCTGYAEGQPMTYCNIEEFVSRINTFGLCGRKGWRVPSRQELESLVDFGRTMPAINTDFFPNTKNNFYWSYAPVVGQKESAWGVSFQFGYSGPLKRDNGRNVRLVRSWSENHDK